MLNLAHWFRSILAASLSCCCVVPNDQDFRCSLRVVEKESVRCRRRWVVFEAVNVEQRPSRKPHWSCSARARFGGFIIQRISAKRRLNRDDPSTEGPSSRSPSAFEQNSSSPLHFSSSSFFPVILLPTSSPHLHSLTRSKMAPRNAPPPLNPNPFAQ